MSRTVAGLAGGLPALGRLRQELDHLLRGHRAPSVWMMLCGKQAMRRFGSAALSTAGRNPPMSGEQPQRLQDSADRRTELAADRTVFAAERTYAAWVRPASPPWLSNDSGNCPLFAGTAAPPSVARDQSVASACAKRSNSTRWSFSQIPAPCQSRKRRQQIMS